MLLNYVHGNPRPRKKATKASKKKNPVSFSEVKKIAKDLEKESKTKAKPKASERKAVKRATEKAVKNQQKSRKEISDDFQKLQEGEKVMAKKKAKKKSAKMFHAKVTVHKKKTAKKAKKKVAKKATAKKATKTKAKRKVAKKAVAKKPIVKKARKARKSKAKAVKTVAKKARKVAKKARKVRKSRKARRSSVASVEFTSKTMPRGFKDMKKGQKRKVQLTVAPKRKKRKSKGAKKKNPIVRSNPSKHTRFEGTLTRKNPFNKVSNAISSFEGKISSALRPLDNVLTKFVGVESMEVIGLAFGSSMDGALYNAIAKIPKSDLVLSKLPQEYKHEIVSGATGLLLHGLNTLLEKKGGKGSMILESLSKGMILSAMVKSIAKISPMSSENAVSAPATVSGLYYAPKSQMGAIANQDFQGVDFEGVDFEGVDFEGIVTESNSMSGLVMEGDYSDETEMEVPDYTLAE